MAGRRTRAALTEEEYWRIYNLIYGDVEAAIKSNRTYLAIQNLAKEDPDVLTRINKDADFLDAERLCPLNDVLHRFCPPLRFAP